MRLKSIINLWKFRHMKTLRHVPRSKPFIPFITGPRALEKFGGTDFFHEFIDMRHKEFGPIFREYMTQDLIFISDPRDMRHMFGAEGVHPNHVYPRAWKLYNKLKKCQRGLFFMEGEEWRLHRSVMNQVLLKEDHQYYMDCCQGAADATVDRLQTVTKDGEVLNLEDVLYRWAVESVSSVLLGKNYGPSWNKIAPIIAKLTTVMRDVFEATAVIETYPVRIAQLLGLKAWKDFEKAEDAALPCANELAAVMLDNCKGGDGHLERLVKKGLDLDMDRAAKIIADLLLAAGDTSVHTMEWILYLLATHPEIQQRVYEATHPVQNMHKIPDIMKHVLKETLRLYPVAPFLNRTLSHDTLFKDYYLEANTLVIYSMYSANRDPKNFPEPEKFLPDRWQRCNMSESWNETNMKYGCPIASQPFAMGRRSCIGKKMAESLIFTTIATILGKYELRAIETDVKMIMRLVAVPNKPIRIALKERK